MQATNCITGSCMKIHHAIFIHGKDNKLAVRHTLDVQSLGPRMEHYLYYGLDETPCLDWGPGDWRISLGVHGSRDNMALKVYGLMKHALTIPGWTHLFKTDVNTIINKVDWEAVEKADYAGLVVKGPAERTYKNEEREPLLREPYLGPMAKLWCGGSGYFVSRRLAQMVVDRGAWAARGHYAEDQMVAMIAEENGIVPVPAVAYGQYERFTT